MNLIIQHLFFCVLFIAISLFNNLFAFNFFPKKINHNTKRNINQFKDTDGDGVYDYKDNCPNKANKDQLDSNENGIGDVCDDGDADDDGLRDDYDLCPLSPNNVDSDGDGICDSLDNCPYKENTDQNDNDNDGIGDVCDDPDNDSDDDGFLDNVDDCPVAHLNYDIDNDCISDRDDNCFDKYNPNQEDVDGDGIGDSCDPFNNLIDLDGDGIPDIHENDEDDDGDGIPNNIDSENDNPCNAHLSRLTPRAAAFCKGGLVLKLEENFEYSSYSWSTGQTGEFITVNKPGNYSVTFTDKNECAYTSSITIKNYNPDSIESILLDNGYLATPGEVINLPGIAEGLILQESIFDTDIVDLTNNGSFKYKGEIYTFFEMVKTSFDLLIEDQNPVTSIIAYEFCGTSSLSIEQFLNYANAGPNISTFVLDRDGKQDLLFSRVTVNNR